ncbi:hypothetical protein HYU20_04085 [Candidatus Woesearchaeota archaeon]|nr:hypothetical protein [Candidatus Woesearchaeota archaeon]
MQESGKREVAALSRGFVQVNNDEIIVLADRLELAHEIDVERAKRAQAKAEEAKAKQEQEKEAKEAKQKEQRASSFSALATKFRAAALKASAFWPYAIAGIGVLVLLAGGFYIYKAKKIKPAAEWFKTSFRTSAADSADWFAVLFTAARMNSIKIVALAVVVAAAIAAFVFRGWLLGKISKAPDSALGVLLAVRDFFSAYRIYIAIGIIALLAILGLLFVLERKGKETETIGTASVKTVKTKASKK